MDLWMLACALFCFGFAAFHMFFWRLFRWSEELLKVGDVNRALIQILNLRLIYVLLAVGVICLAYPLEMRTTKVGRALLIGMSCFWGGRLTEQFIFFHHDNKAIITWSALFITGATLFLLPALL